MRRRDVVVIALALAVPVGCGWDPRRPFERESPDVKHATALYDAGDARAAATTLEDYLGTGECKEGAIGAPEALNEKREGTFDLGLALFAVADAYGARFQSDGKTTPLDADPKSRVETVTCALRIVRAVLDSPSAGYALRARAHYLEGNLHFLSGDYAQAIKAYEQALVLLPGAGDGGAGTTDDERVGRDAAWNRAVAMRRLEDEKDAGPDSGPPDGGDDGGQDGGSDGGNKPDGGQDGGGQDGGKDGGGQDAGGDSGQNGNGGPDGGNDASPPPPNDRDGGNGGDDAGAPPPSEPETPSTPDDRILNDLERAPMLQHELSRRAAQSRKVRGMADK